MSSSCRTTDEQAQLSHDPHQVEAFYEEVFMAYLKILYEKLNMGLNYN